MIALKLGQDQPVQSKIPQKVEFCRLCIKLGSEINGSASKLRVAETSAYKANYMLSLICSGQARTTSNV